MARQELVDSILQLEEDTNIPDTLFSTARIVLPKWAVKLKAFSRFLRKHGAIVEKKSTEELQATRTFKDWMKEKECIYLAHEDDWSNLDVLRISIKWLKDCCMQKKYLDLSSYILKSSKKTIDSSPSNGSKSKNGSKLKKVDDGKKKSKKDKQPKDKVESNDKMKPKRRKPVVYEESVAESTKSKQKQKSRNILPKDPLDLIEEDDGDDFKSTNKLNKIPLTQRIKSTTSNASETSKSVVSELSEASSSELSESSSDESSIIGGERSPDNDSNRNLKRDTKVDVARDETSVEEEEEEEEEVLVPKEKLVTKEKLVPKEKLVTKEKREESTNKRERETDEVEEEENNNPSKKTKEMNEDDIDSDDTDNNTIKKAWDKNEDSILKAVSILMVSDIKQAKQLISVLNRTEEECRNRMRVLNYL